MMPKTLSFKNQSFKISYFPSKIWDMGYIVLLLANHIRDIFRVNDKSCYHYHLYYRDHLLPAIVKSISSRFESFEDSIFQAMINVDHHRWDYDDTNYEVLVIRKLTEHFSISLQFHSQYPGNCAQVSATKEVGACKIPSHSISSNLVGQDLSATPLLFLTFLRSLKLCCVAVSRQAH